MSFLSKIFKKKDGGTFFGNLLRKATGKPLPSAPMSITKTDKDYLTELRIAYEDGILTKAEYDKQVAAIKKDYSSSGGGSSGGLLGWLFGGDDGTERKPLVDINKIIGTPNVNTGIDKQTKSFIGLVLLGLAAIFILPKLFSRSGRHH